MDRKTELEYCLGHAQQKLSGLVEVKDTGFHSGILVSTVSPISTVIENGIGPGNHDDLEFDYATPTDLRALLKEIDRFKGVLEGHIKAIEHWESELAVLKE